jgi:FkbM family methyltransferase
MTFALKKFAAWLWFFRGRLNVFDVPMPWPLPYGGIFLSHGDVMGLGVVRATFKKEYENVGEWKFLARYLREGMCFFDVGANQGFFTLLAAQKTGTGGRVFAFEPSPREFARLCCNIRLNRFKNVVLEPVAVGTCGGLTDFHVCLGKWGSLSSIMPLPCDTTDPQQTIKVPVTSIDAYSSRNNIEQIDFIKIDVEGGELDVLKGGINVLISRRPLVMCEMADVRTRQWGYFAREIYRFLADIGYLWFRLSLDGLLEPARDREKYDPDWENLVAVPDNKMNLIAHLRED